MNDQRNKLIIGLGLGIIVLGAVVYFVWDTRSTLSLKPENTSVASDTVVSGTVLGDSVGFKQESNSDTESNPLTNIYVNPFK
jgi:ribosome biogenesis SPOUT family RNA methylase Rps3